MKKPGRVVIVVLIVLVIVAAGTAAGAYLAARHFLYTPVAAPLPGEDPEEVLLEIAPGESLRGVAASIAEVGLAREARVLEYYARYRGLQARLQAGRYVLSRDLSPVEVLQRIVSGDAVFEEIRITIPEGWSANEIAMHLEEIQLFPAELSREALVMQDAYRDLPFLQDLEDDTILDGYLFPDTYGVSPQASPEVVVRLMLSNFARRVLTPLQEDISSGEYTLHEILTLASIVQKESADTPEMPDVAGVFRNRLEIGMRLESDATVNYVLGTRRRQPTFADTATEHPYNTYRNAGLPPGPIGNPGLEAIRATVFPAEHEFLFFLHKHTYEIVLTRTFAEHLAAKARYLD